MKNRNYFSQIAVNLTVFFAFIAASFLFGCVHTKQVTAPDLQDKPEYFKDIGQAAQKISNSISRQLESITDTAPKPNIIVDVFFNEQSAEVSSSGLALQNKIIEFLPKTPPAWPVYPLSGKSLQNAKWVVIGSYRFEQPDKLKTAEKWVKIRVDVRDIHNDLTVATSEAYVDSAKFNSEPVKFYKDAPMYMTSKNISSKQPGMPKLKLADRLALDAKLADARTAYNEGNYALAETLFTEVVNLSRGTNFVAYSGIYQCQFRSGRLSEAEASFGKLVAAGLDSGSLSVKFLFKLNSTDFLHLPDLTAQYPIWIRQISRQLASKNQCMTINGHASKTGSEELNNRLSKQRAERLSHLLRKSNPSLAHHLKAVGKGFSQNIVGSGTNDAMDAIDRRVDFEIVSCN